MTSAIIRDLELERSIPTVKLVRPRRKTPRPTNIDVMIMDTGGGPYSTITRRAWYILNETSHSTLLTGYQDSSEPTEWPIGNAVTKATFPGREPVLYAMNYATIIDDDNVGRSLSMHAPWSISGSNTN